MPREFASCESVQLGVKRAEERFRRALTPSFGCANQRRYGGPHKPLTDPQRQASSNASLPYSAKTSQGFGPAAQFKDRSYLRAFQEEFIMASSLQRRDGHRGPIAA